jgi:uncharacterized protein
MGPAALALALALVGGLIDMRGLTATIGFAASCWAARRSAGIAGILSHAIMLALGVGFFVHAIPGFDNPRVLTDIVLSPGAVPYTKFLNFDKGLAALFLLGLYAPERPADDEGAQHLGEIVWRVAVVVAVLLALAASIGYVRWDPKLPSWWALWLWSMVFLTALPEEAAFRGIIQTWLARRFAGAPRAAMIAVAGAGVLFGLAHAAGGPLYILLASTAGIGYGWVCATTKSLGGAIAAHTALNTVHLLFFTYPALAG